jgi:exopolyphosphatase/pppGpp-phosphohydrolase
MIVSSVDIGTNTVRCLVALCEEGVLTPVSVHRQIVRLGAGLRTEGRRSGMRVVKTCLRWGPVL